MRRGRPTSTQHSTKPSPSPSSDPFAVLDGGNKKGHGGDELSSRFPTLDQFSLLHEKSGKFEFQPTVAETKASPDGLAQRVTNALADEAFTRPAPAPSTAAATSRSPAPALGAHGHVREASPMPSPDLRESARQQTPLHQPIPQKPAMVSTGTMTSPSPPPMSADKPAITARPIHRFPTITRGSRSVSHNDHTMDISSMSHDSVPTRKSFLLKRDSKHAASTEDLPIPPSSSRPSLEGQRPHYLMDFEDPLTRSKSANAKPRPASAYVSPKPDIYSDHDNARTSFESGLSRSQFNEDGFLRPAHADRSKISSDIDFLRAKEEEQNRKREKRMSTGSKHAKKSSFSSLSIPGKGIFAGRFGEAFRKFETNGPEDQKNHSESPVDRVHLTPIAGSEVADLSDDDRDRDLYDDVDNRDDISPEMRRELERRRMSMEERRVIQAAAEYRARIAEKGEGGGHTGGVQRTRSTSIQNKVQAFLRQQQEPPPPKTASGYGRYTEAEAASQAKQFEASLPDRPHPGASRQDVPVSHEPRPQVPPKDIHAIRPPSSSAQFTGRAASKPEPPPKPKSLRTTTFSDSPVADNDGQRYSMDRNQQTTPKDDWEHNFSRRYPSLSGLEMVETEIGLPKVPAVRTKEV